MSLNNNQDIRGRCTVFGPTVPVKPRSHPSGRLLETGQWPKEEMEWGSESRVEEGRLETGLCCSSRTQLPEKLLQCRQKHFPACLTGPRWHLPESSCWHSTRRRRAISLQRCKACLLMKCFVTSRLSERRFILFRFYFLFFLKEEISRFKGISRTCSVETLPWRPPTVGGKPHRAFMGFKQSLNIMRLYEFS